MDDWWIIAAWVCRNELWHLVLLDVVGTSDGQITNKILYPQAASIAEAILWTLCSLTCTTLHVTG